MWLCRCNFVSGLFTLSLFYTHRLLCCCVKEKQGMVNRGSGWSPFSGLPGHTVKSADRRRALSFQHNLRCCSPLSFLFCRLFVAVYGTALIHIEGAFEESTSVRLFHPVSPPLPIYIRVSISPSFFLSPSVCISLKSTFAFHYSISVFLTLLHLPTLMQHPLAFSHHLFIQIFLWLIFLFLFFFAFCFVDYNSCVHPSKPPYLSSTLNLAPRSKCLFQYMSLSLQVYLLCTFQTLSLWSFQDIFLRLSPLCSKFPPVYKVIIYFCFSKSYLAFSSFPFLLSCSIVPASLSYAACPSLYLYVMPYLNILLHRVPLLSPSVLVCFLSISIVLTLSPPPSYSFGVWPLLPLLLCTHFRLKYIYVYTLSVYSPLF